MSVPCKDSGSLMVPVSAGIVRKRRRRRRGSERSLDPSKAGEEGSSFVTPRSTDPLRWVHQPAGCLGQQRVLCPASEVPSSPFLGDSHEGEMTFALPNPREPVLLWGRDEEKAG